MGKTARRAGVAGFVLALSATLTAPAAFAEEADPALAGSCDATLRDEPGKALTLDAGAPLDQPGVLTVGTGSESAPTGPDQRGPLLPLPVADLAKALNLGDAPVVGDLATEQLCPGVQGTVNTLSAATQSLVSGKPLDPPSTGDPSPGEPQPGEQTPAPGTPGTPAPGATGGIVPASFVTGGFLIGSGIIPSTTPLSALIQPGVVPPAAPALVPPAGTEPPLVTQNSGTAEAMPSSSVPDRLPLIIAVFALAIVAAALTRAWMRRA
ncbi:hypothetical protein GCM10017786_51040 [Amycolatopsis deserti]|uniref:Uncharacterized protein n=1 Tax=Amycolatopsis deserti TaxID=185696 RepID=A0ABQ3J8T3_9PSEU|nr:hypothetical protein [Amycolatopsis deserti]GHF11126.1 hypothetical protein GCM10017786_51040 [Amycolatopsis deserti]